MVVAEGVDYSSTRSNDWNALALALKNEGKTFAGRYAVYDKSPGGRGITAAEYKALKSHGIDVFLYYEENTSWMLGGFDAGVRAARRATDVIEAEGLPEGMPVYYSDDIAPEIDDFNAVIQCLHGAASIVGLSRVGLYGGWDAIHNAQAAAAARFYCQTIAWQYDRGMHPGIHLHQYNTGQPSSIYIGGTDVDLVAAIQKHYGQASDFTGKPVPPTYAKPIPPSLKSGKPYAHIDENDIPWLELTPRRWVALRDVPRKQRASDASEDVGPVIKKGGKVTFIYSVSMSDGEVWLVSKAGSRCRGDAFIPTK